MRYHLTDDEADPTKLLAARQAPVGIAYGEPATTAAPPTVPFE